MPREIRSSRYPRRATALAAAVSAAFAFLGHPARADTTAIWLGETGDWTDPTQWSTNPIFPNGAGFDADISGTVTLDAEITLDNLTLNGGTIQRGTINLAGQIFGSGTANDVAFAGGDLQVNGALFIQNGITIANHNLDLGDDSELFFDGPSQSVDNLNITGDGSIYASGPNSPGPGTLTLGSNVTVNGGVYFGNYQGYDTSDSPYTNSDTLINNGTINVGSIEYGTFDLDNLTNNGTVEATGGVLQFRSLNWANNGTISADGGSVLYLGSSINETEGIASTWTNYGTISAGSSTMYLGGAWTNNGTISADGGSTMYLQGTWTNAGTISATNNSTVDLRDAGFNLTTANIGTLTADATSTVSIIGSVDNTDATLRLSGGGTLFLDGTISGGIVDVGGGNFTVDDATLSGVAVTGGDLKVNEGGSVVIRNEISIANHNLDLGYDCAVFFDGQSQFVNNLNITSGIDAEIYVSGPTSGGPETLTLGNNVTVHGGASFGSYHQGDALVNNGTISADNAENADAGYSIYISVDNFTNNGTAGATDGDGLYISSANWTNNGTISATNEGEVYLGGTASGIGVGNLTTDATGSILLAGTINGGIVDVGGGNISADGATFNGVSISGGDLQVSQYGSLSIQNGISIANHNLDLGADSSLYFDGPSQSVDDLNITPTGEASIYASGPTSVGPGTLTLGSNVTVHGGAQFVNNNIGDGLINNGTIIADSASDTSINLTNFTNNGTAEAAEDSTLILASTNFINNGYIVLHHGTINAPNGLNIGGGTLSGAGDINGTLTLSSDPSTLEFQLRSEDDYDYLSVDGDVALAGELKVVLANGFTPASSDVFVVMDVESPYAMSGAFSNVADGAELETTNGSGSFVVSYDDSGQIVLTDFELPAPEPTAPPMLLACSVGLLMQRCRRTAPC